MRGERFESFTLRVSVAAHYCHSGGPDSRDRKYMFRLRTSPLLLAFSPPRHLLAKRPATMPSRQGSLASMS